MSNQEKAVDFLRSKEQSVLAVLEAYRERRRARRGEDTYFGSSDVFRAVVEEGISPSELDSRREAILAEAKAEGMPIELAELLYDIAREEGLDPAIAYELVRTGLGVATPQDLTTGTEEPVTDKYLPNWLFPATPPDALLRERMLRVSFRRLRSMLADEEDVSQAFRNFAGEPDVGFFGY